MATLINQLMELVKTDQVTVKMESVNFRRVVIAELLLFESTAFEKVLALDCDAITKNLFVYGNAEKYIKENNKMEIKYCDQCENQCPIDALKCGKGRRHFGMESNDDNDGHNRKKPEGTLGLLLQCGHFLHHSGISRDDLLNALYPDEQAELGRLLETLLRDWKNRVPAENHHGHHGR